MWGKQVPANERGHVFTMQYYDSAVVISFNISFVCTLPLAYTLLSWHH